MSLSIFATRDMGGTTSLDLKQKKASKPAISLTPATPPPAPAKK
jgi:hypothetical protein